MLWAFCGIRRGVDRDQDLELVRPTHAIIAGVLGASLFVAAIVTVVRLVTSGS